MSHTILIIDDEPNILRFLSQALNIQGYKVITSLTGASGLEEVLSKVIDLVLLDLKLPDTTGIEVLRAIREQDRDLPVIMLTAFGDVSTAVQAMKLGAGDYLSKPFDLEELLLMVRKLLETSAMYRELRQLRREKQDPYKLNYIVGYSAQMRAVFDLVGQVAQSENTSVLLEGESGTGKEIIAHAIHERSQRSDGPFLAINCAAIPDALLESELFGYEAGAFTDAKRQKRGLLEMAEGGTLFLDEISEMKPEMQAKLLRVLEERAFRRVGGTHESKINVRFIAATNSKLEVALQSGAFRPDLYYRLSVVQIKLPPLRERAQDVMLFAATFIEEFNTALKKNVRSISPAAQRLLVTYPWPGNVRELRNVIERAMILGQGPEIIPDHLPLALTGGPGPGTRGRDEWERWLNLRPTEPLTLEEVKDKVEQTMIHQALEACQGNQSRAAKLIGLNYDLLRYRMKKHQILTS